jgi:hypothetical protein
MESNDIIFACAVTFFRVQGGSLRQGQIILRQYIIYPYRYADP